MINPDLTSEQRLADLHQLKRKLYLNMAKEGSEFDQFVDKCNEWRKQFPDTWQFCRLFHFFCASTISEEGMASGKIFEDFEGNLVENYVRGLLTGK